MSSNTGHWKTGSTVTVIFLWPIDNVSLWSKNVECVENEIGCLLGNIKYSLFDTPCMPSPTQLMDTNFWWKSILSTTKHVKVKNMQREKSKKSLHLIYSTDFASSAKSQTWIHVKVKSTIITTMQYYYLDVYLHFCDVPDACDVHHAWFKHVTINSCECFYICSKLKTVQDTFIKCVPSLPWHTVTLLWSCTL